MYWADICRAGLDALLEAHDSPEDIPTHRFVALASQWYASLWVVIEGWKALCLQDEAVDELLREHSEIADLLRRYRNGVFHFQRDIADDRLLGLMRVGDRAQIWVRILHDEFARFLSDWVAELPGSVSQGAQLREEIYKLLGWLPESTRTDHRRSLQTTISQGEALLRSGDQTSEEARELRKAILRARSLLLSNAGSSDPKELLES